MADFTDWYDDTKRKLKTPISKQCLDYIRDIVNSELSSVPAKVRERVQFIETDGGSLIAWRRGKRIYHLLTPNQGEILVRGDDVWPRGMTRRYDQMSRVLDARINQEDDAKVLRNFLSNGPIAQQRRQDLERAERRRNRKVKLRAKVNG